VGVQPGKEKIMNSPYLQDRLVELKMKEIQRELQQARLLKEAGLSDSNLLARAAQALHNLLKARKRFQDHHSIQPRAYQRDKLVP
jgi:hypothetical protein